MNNNTATAMVRMGTGVRASDEDVKDALASVEFEVRRAEMKHLPMHSAHEGHSVIREEVEELWDHVKADTGYTPEAYDEAKQIAAMGIRYMLMIKGKVRGQRR